MPKNTVSLDDKYALDETRQLLTGTQAIVRLMLTQRARDVRAGLNTAGYVTGYRGSPIASLEAAMLRARGILEPNHIKFMAGLNEDLAATALWGTQQAELRGEGKYDGVFGIWYGKGPGVDRTGDVFRHANHAGTSKHGGVLALMGDDHTCESSTTAHQSEFAFLDFMIPILNPAGVQEILDYGVLGFALSRYAGVWVGLKCVKDNIEATSTVDGRIDRVQVKIPEDFVPPPGGLNIRLGDPTLVKEARLHDSQAPADPGVQPRQQDRSHRHERRPEAEARHHHHRQELSRRAPGPGRARHRRGQGQPARHPRLQGRHDLAARAAGRARVRQGPRPDPGRRGEARTDRDAGEGAALRSARAATRARQEGRERASGCSLPSTRSIPPTSPSSSASG